MRAAYAGIFPRLVLTQHCDCDLVSEMLLVVGHGRVPGLAAQPRPVLVGLGPQQDPADGGEGAGPGAVVDVHRGLCKNKRKGYTQLSREEFHFLGCFSERMTATSVAHDRDCTLFKL